MLARQPNEPPTSRASYQCGIVPISADPVTLGHLDLIRYARERCVRVVVFVGENERKAGSHCFSLAERAAMVERALRHFEITDPELVAIGGFYNVKVIASDGLLTDTYLREGCDALFRGLRTPADRASDEAQMALYAEILPSIAGHIIYVPALPERQLVSSTMVKAFVAHNLDVSRYVPAFVKQALEDRICGQHRIAITGGIATGKGWVAGRLVEYFHSEGKIDAHHIDVDSLQRDVYDEDSPGAQILRYDLAKILGAKVLVDNGRHVNRSEIARIIFSPTCSPKIREVVEELVAPHVWRKFREAIHGKRGIIIFEWAQLAEMGLGDWANHHVIVVDSPDREQFAAKRGVSDRAAALAKIQWGTDKKVLALSSAARSAGNGSVTSFMNRAGGDTAADIAALAAQVRTVLQIPK